ncbi:MAG: hypothetical protein IJ594_10595 [Oscillospiraceae bacterium]|nr:hypothetical protein [Oscillospiraceae bacterium]
MTWIEKERSFPQIDPQRESYFAPVPQAPAICAYGFRTLPEFRQLLQARLGDALTEREMLEIAKLTFRSKPADADEPISLEGRQLVDFIYEL